MSEAMTVQTPQQPNLSSQARTQSDITVRDFVELLRENGLDRKAQSLTELLGNMDHAEAQFDSLHRQIETLQSEMEHLQSDTPLTDYFKKEMNSRAYRFCNQLDELSDRFLIAKDTMLEAAYQGVRNFVSKGKVALHHACASMYGVGIQYFEASRNLDFKVLDYSKNLLEQVNEISPTAKEVRQQRNNLVRSLFGRKPKQPTSEHEGAFYDFVRRTAEADITSASTNIHDKTKILLNLENHRNRHLDCVKRKPSFDEKLSDAKKRAEFSSKTSPSREHSHANLSR